MPYALIATLAALASTGWFVIAARASLTAKVLVSVLCAASLAIGFLWPQWWLAGLLVQALIVIGIRLYATASRNRSTASAPNE
ncbi:hypothetical protein K4L06_14645 [Lysobacter sp. BMK333-48F3]|uniref:hypothetical protein n=1 Tax=Lysobacter sp. BMK333-48F3 TaxID=2867962 RepID=UPI001C8BE840|nr:hypothetical protein [Lysobacter sp. BMK333-48F3]MBX9402546.1 hypothetical protein [Lysobacter sp. BMK333-48F3]